MAKAELILVRGAHTLGGFSVFTGGRGLFLGIFHGVPGQTNVLVELAQSIVADVHRLVDVVRVRGQSGLVAATTEQVVVHHNAHAPFVVVTFVTLHVVVRTNGGFSIEAWVERRLGDFVLALGRLHVGLRRFQVRVVVDHALLGFAQLGGQFAASRGRGFQFIGHAPDDAVEIGFGIGQINFGGVEVVLCQGFTGYRLVGVGGAADAALGTQANLIVDAQVRLQVVRRQRHQFAALEHFEVDLDGAQGQVLRGALRVVGARVGHTFGALDFVGRVETIEDHLPHAQLGLGVGEDFGVVIAEGPGVGVVAVAATVSRVQIDGWIEATLGDFDLFISRKARVHARRKFRVGGDSALNRLREVHCLGLRSAGHGQQNRAAEGG